MYTPAFFAGGVTGTTYIAADGSLLPVQALPVSATAAQSGSTQSTPSVSQPSSQSDSTQASQPTQIVTQVASVVSQPVTSSTAGHLPMQIQMVTTPVHIQMHPQGQAPISQSQIIHSGSQTGTVHTSHATTLAQTQPASSVPVPLSLAMSHQVLSHPVSITHSQPHTTVHLTHSTLHPTSQSQVPTPTTPNKPNASPRPSILRKRDNEG